MKRYIHEENIALFKKKLADPKTTDTEREIVQELLVQEEANKIPERKIRRPARSSISTELDEVIGTRNRNPS